MISNNNKLAVMKLVSLIARKEQKRLERKFDVMNSDSPYYNYDGLCIVSSNDIIRFINRHWIGLEPGDEHPMYIIYAREIQGELSHNPFIESDNWPIQHSICEFTIQNRFDNDDKLNVYVDCTCHQFADIIPNIPSIYVSEKIPWWFYPDRKNYAYNGLTHYINKISITRRLVIDNDVRVVHDGLIEIIQYELWGAISDFIRKLLKIDKRRKQ